VTVAAGKTAATFTVTASKSTRNTSAVISATYLGVTKSATLSIRRGKMAIAVVDPGPAVVEGRR
jgi:TctA family transporter